MEDNKSIFDGAKFGDKFICRNGEIAIYQESYDLSIWLGCDVPNIQHRLFTKGYILDVGDDGILGLDDDGLKELEDMFEEITPQDNGDYDILSRHIESNQEVKQLKDELDALNIKYLSQVSLYKSLYEETKKKLEKYEHD